MPLWPLASTLRRSAKSLRVAVTGRRAPTPATWLVMQLAELVRRYRGGLELAEPGVDAVRGLLVVHDLLNDGARVVPPAPGVGGELQLAPDVGRRCTGLLILACLPVDLECARVESVIKTEVDVMSGQVCTSIVKQNLNRSSTKQRSRQRESYSCARRGEGKTSP